MNLYQIFNTTLALTSLVGESQLGIDPCYQKRSSSALGLGIFLTVGTFVTYVPQVAEFIVKKSSKGVSSAMLFFMNTSSFTNTLAAMIFDFEDEVCCTKVTFWQCNEQLLDQWVVAMNIVGSFPMFVLFVYFLKSIEDETERKRGYILFFVFVAYASASITAAGVLLYSKGYLSSYTVNFAKAQGVVSDITNALLWIPQMYYTYKLKSPGSLSLIMLFLQAPGTAVVCVFYIFLEHAKAYIWLPFFVNLVTMTILFFEASFYYWREKLQKRREQQQGNVQDEEDQRESLLKN